MHLCSDVFIRMNFARFIVVASIAVLTARCGGSTTTISQVTAPDAVRCQTSVASPPSTVPHAGSQVTLTVVAERECSWTATSEATWAKVAPAAGQGQATVSVTVSANPDASVRSGAIAINETRLSLTQEAAPCRFQLGSSQSQMSHTGGRTSVNISAPNGCAWRASSSDTWARLLSDSGTGSGTVEIDVSANSGAERTATISIADQSMVLVQAARASNLPGCTTGLDPNDRTFGPTGGDGSVRVAAPSGCSWSAAASASWIELSGSSGTGTDTVRYRVTANTSTSLRTGTIVIDGRTHTVRQDAPATGGGGGGEEQKIDLSGRALLVEGSCPSISFVVDLRRVFTNGDTKFHGDCKDIRNGTDVKVEGRVQTDGRVRATEVRVHN
jgi:hypothetical protein